MRDEEGQVRRANNQAFSRAMGDAEALQRRKDALSRPRGDYFICGRSPGDPKADATAMQKLRRNAAGEEFYHSSFYYD